MQVKNIKALPSKVENRLRELREMKEFNDHEIELCRNGYWDDRDGWHTILINCYDHAKTRRTHAA